MASIAFVGLGNMGRGMARRLLDAGHEVRVYNRTASRAGDLRNAGARLCATPREASEGADAVFGMTADDDSSRSVWLGADGVLAARLNSRALAVECSTLSHEWVMQLADASRTHGLRYVDSPVTGLPQDAAAGALTLLVGAEAQDLEAARPLLQTFSNRILHFGGVGSGTAYKLIVNLIGAVQIGSLAEGMALAERAGLDLRVVREAISTGQAASPQVVRNARRMIASDHDQNVVFTPVLRLKDVDYALRLANERGLGAPFGELAARGLRELLRMGYASVHESKIIEVARAQQPEHTLPPP